MRILALSSWWPEPADNGIKLRILHLLRALAHEHEVHLAALTYEPADTSQRREIDQLCASATALTAPHMQLRRKNVIASLWHAQPASVRARWSPQFAQTVQSLSKATRPDLVLAFEVSVAPYARLIPGVARVLDDTELVGFAEQPALESSIPRKIRSWLTWSKQRSYVRELLQDFGACSVVSEPELKLVQSLAHPALRIALIPNGAEITTARADWGEPEPDTLIYPGSLTFGANLDAMRYFLGEIFPAIRAKRPNIRFRITGRAEPEQIAMLPSVEHVDLVGFVPDIHAIVARSWCEVVPLREGSGTRLKVLEALALGTPVVTTPKGVEGLDLVHDTHVLIAPTPKEFAEATVRLLEQPELRERLSVAGKQRVTEYYDWRMIGQRFNALVMAAVEQHRGQVASPEYVSESRSG